MSRLPKQLKQYESICEELHTFYLEHIKNFSAEECYKELHNALKTKIKRLPVNENVDIKCSCPNCKKRAQYITGNNDYLCWVHANNFIREQDK